MSRFLLLAAAAASLCAAPAHAEQMRQTRVRYGDLNISSQAGAEALIVRIEQAAIEICSDPMDSRTIDGRARTLECANEAIERAVRALDHPMVEARFAQRDPARLALAAR